MLLIVKEDDLCDFYITKVIQESLDNREVIVDFIDEYCNQQTIEDKQEFLAKYYIDRDGIFTYNTKDKSFYEVLGGTTEFYLSKDINNEYFIKDIFNIDDNITVFDNFRDEMYYDFLDTLLNKTIEVFNKPTPGMYMALNKGEALDKENLYIYKID